MVVTQTPLGWLGFLGESIEASTGFGEYTPAPPAPTGGATGPVDPGQAPAPLWTAINVKSTTAAARRDFGTAPVTESRPATERFVFQPSGPSSPGDQTAAPTPAGQMPAPTPAPTPQPAAPIDVNAYASPPMPGGGPDAPSVSRGAAVAATQPTGAAPAIPPWAYALGGVAVAGILFLALRKG